MPAPLRIDPETCIGCESCLPVCVNECISMRDGVAHLAEERCIACDHCVAVCPEKAISSMLLDKPLDFGPFSHSQDWMQPGAYDQGELVRLMRSRRSCRNYTSEAVDRSLLEQLCQVGATAPSGTNSQRWTFSILPERKQVMAFGRHVADFFRSLNRLARIPLLRNGLALVGQKELAEYHREYYLALSEALKRYDEHGDDRLFHGASAVIIVGSNPGASCPAEDALLATQNILLAAHAVGLGTCLIGYAVEAMRHKRKIQKALGWHKKEEVYAVIALGHPDENYLGLTGRKELDLRFLDDFE